MELFVAFFTLMFFALVVGVKLVFISLVLLFSFLLFTPYGWVCLIVFILFSCCKSDTK